MKNLTYSMLAIVFLLTVVPLSFAETYNKRLGQVEKIVAGQVVSVNTNKGSFVIKDRDNGKQETVYADAEAIASLTSGAEATVTLPATGNYASKVTK